MPAHHDAMTGLSDAAYYSRLQHGALYLASRTLVRAERVLHLGKAEAYGRLAANASRGISQ